VLVSEWASLLTGIGGILAALGGIATALITWLRTSPQEREDAARRAIDQVLDDDVLNAAADGKITPEEAADLIRRRKAAKRLTEKRKEVEEA
jgi:hypothetical protein